MEQAQEEPESEVRVFFKFWAPFLLCAVAIYFGAQYFVLRHDLHKSQCIASYWKGRTLGQPSSYCPPGCICDPWMLR